ncbi:NADH-quinone oxidoreductase subunit N [Ohtaekwangia koreensis]|uniref:NADH-quinone oxidoreductase subunit N n=1 Tax=Ohtaekwangia koreensis TaxID=688867 RepID=A0A1T5LR68_9BACT|nr:NADH-quinone oxidoreductase subunit N [Ohtaekwangia koreensis]SKC78473.1 NADH-quinone oxidoreductase subunit N [Ohtaekwangia koreensis]
MGNDLRSTLDHIFESLLVLGPEVILSIGILLVIIVGLVKKEHAIPTLLSLLIFSFSFLFIIADWKALTEPISLFQGMLRQDTFSLYLRGLTDIAGILTVLMSWRNQGAQRNLSEYYALIIAAVLGTHLLVMSTNLLMVFLSLELISISSYVLTGFLFDKKGAEGSLKYFLFGSVASAVMLYGLSMFYGFTGTLDFTSEVFFTKLYPNQTPLFFIAGLMTVSGFLYKIAAAPLHPWAPDVYEAAPMPIIAFFSVVPKLAGIGVLTRFIMAINLGGSASYDWQFVLGIVAILSLTVGNFSALMQKNPKRLMAYSSIAQAGFLLIGVIAFLPQGIQFMLFYATVYVVMNFLVFIYLQYFEKNGFVSIAEYSGIGKTFLWPSIFLLIALISLTGLPPTAGFTAKLFIFSSLWEAYQLTGKNILVWLLIFGLLNTVVSLFYYLRIPYYAFIKNRESELKTNILAFENLFGFVLVLLILLFFFSPGLLMGWINKITFVFVIRYPLSVIG